jgi:integration host factor subunit beta
MVKIEKMVNAILDGIVAAMSRRDRVEIRGFGAFSARNRRAHVGFAHRRRQIVSR